MIDCSTPFLGPSQWITPVYDSSQPENVFQPACDTFEGAAPSRVKQISGAIAGLLVFATGAAIFIESGFRRIAER